MIVVVTTQCSANFRTERCCIPWEWSVAMLDQNKQPLLLFARSSPHLVLVKMAATSKPLHTITQASNSNLWRRYLRISGKAELLYGFCPIRQVSAKRRSTRVAISLAPYRSHSALRFGLEFSWGRRLTKKSKWSQDNFFNFLNVSTFKPLRAPGNEGPE